MVDIVNILTTGDLNEEIELKQVAQDLECSDYDPNTFPGLIFQSSIPGTILLFKSGKYSNTGCKNRMKLN
jgi:transcription initiation factor TFIID TATA-box-binding protein